MIEHLVSKEQLASERKDEVRFSRIINESLQTRSRSPRFNETTVFLSHKHSDGEVLRNCGVSVYVDWMDSDMPKHTSGVTATKIKEKISSCQKFILLATESAIASKWCNWELGYGDAHKYRDNIAIMPITETSGDTFSGSEYLQIYPVIKTKYQFTSGEYYVVDGNTEIPLGDWLII